MSRARILRRLNRFVISPDRASTMEMAETIERRRALTAFDDLKTPRHLVPVTAATVLRDVWAPYDGRLPRTVRSDTHRQWVNYFGLRPLHC
jgi:hypothetical protein